ncbi:MAG: hypothetical protein JL56_07295 [Desulfotomaculum sp. BICA1-6]|nr:MAG: hypothetical protein JL56_07295 [Desulfotomaculum sp. BICA1-6]
MKKQDKRYLAFFVVIAFLLTLCPVGTPAYAWSDSGLTGCSLKQQVSISNFSPTSAYYLGVWNVQISGAVSGSGKCAYLNTKTDGGGYGYNFINSSNYSGAAHEMNGEPSFVLSRVSSVESTISWGSGSQRRTYIRDFVNLCGAIVTGYNQGVVYVQTTPKPTVVISPPFTIKSGEQVKITISGTSFVPSGSQSQSVSYKFYVDSSQVDSGSGTKSFSKQVSYTFPTAKTYTLKLEATDGVGRTTTVTRTVAVQAGAQPPQPPPGGNMPPVADFDLPPSAEVNESVNVRDRSVDYDGTITKWEWSVSPSSYTGTLGNTGGAMKFTKEGTYTVKLIVTDNKGAKGECTKYIAIGESLPPPSPPEPPEPENKPPMARFSMPSECGPGETVNVTNHSYDPDGYIVDVDWRVSPSTEVEENLGDDGGTLVFHKLGTYTVKLTVTDDAGDEDFTEDEIEVVNQPPRARIVVPDSIMQGDDVTIRSASRDPDGEIVKLTWSVTPAENMVGELTGESSTVYFDKEGQYTITLTVEDNWGATDTDEVTVTVEPAIPQAFFQDVGAHKQNRMITITEKGQSSARYPIIKELNEWEFLPAGSDATTDAIKVKDVSPDENEMLFKTPGAYRVRLRVTNTAGHTSEWYERTLDIRPDEPPVADFVVQQAYLRDPAIGKKATVEIRDTSYSPDADIIAHRTWKYRYDSDNDGDFNDEQWVVFSDANETAPSFQTDQVGKHLVELEVTEGFGEDTVAEFVSVEDYLKADTSSKPLSEKRTEVINIRPSVGFDVLRKKKADIIFTLGNTEGTGFDANIVQQLNGLINQYLKPELEANNIDNVDYIIKSMDTYGFDSNAANMQNVLSTWRSIEVPSGNIVSGGWEYDPNLKAVVATGSYRPARGLYDTSPEAMNIGDATINFTWGIRNQDGLSFAHGESGYMFRIQDDHNYYLYIWDNHSACGNVRYNGGEVIAKVVNGVLTEITPVQSFPTYYKGQQINVKIELQGDRIKVWRNGDLRFDITDSTFKKGSQGFYIWDQYAAYFKDISVESTRVTTLDEVLKNSSLWRHDAAHFLVNISAVTYPEFADPVISSYIYSRLLNDRIDFSLLGSAANQSQATSIIARNEGQGTFILNNNRNTAMQQLTSYIINKLNGLYPPVENYVLLNEEVYYKTYYNDPEEDPKMAERWKYSHDPAHFENSLGLASFDEQWLPAPVHRFDKVGKFVTTFQARDNPKNDDRFDEYRLWSYMPADSLHLYVHRRPVAMFGVQLSLSGNNFNVTINSDAYDLDHISQPNKGIVEHKWSWRPASNATWNAGKPATLAKDNDYLIRYEVKDIEGVWSFPVVKLVSTRNVNMAPVAQFTVTPNPVVVNKTVTITDLSYDPNGDPIAQRQWRVRPPGGSWGSVTGSPPSKFSTMGEWTVELKVSDGSLWSEPFYQTVQVIPDNTPPVARFTVQPNPVYDCDPVTYTDTSYDPDGDPIVAREWRVRKNGGAWQYYANPPTVFENVGGAGTYDIELRVQDQPKLPQLDPKWSGWYRQTLTVLDSFEVVGSITPNPGERGRNITVNASAVRPSDGQKVVIDSMKVIIPLPQKPDGSSALPPGGSSHEAWMTYDATNMVWHYTYTIPERTVKERWPDDCLYLVKVIGYRDGTAKEDVMELEIKGHIKRRLIIRTLSW